MLATETGSRCLVVSANAAAQRLGIRPGLPLAQARARLPDLLIDKPDPAEDAAALERLALWAVRRYAPIVATDLPAGLIIDITGAAHLIGGEAALLTDLRQRLDAAGIRSRAAAADTVGAAHAVARFSGGSMIVPLGGALEALHSLPIAALRLDPDTIDGLRTVGLETIGGLAATPRAPLALRFGSGPGRRLDQAMGRLAEALDPVRPIDAVSTRRGFAEPIGAAETIARYLGELAQPLCDKLEARGLGVLRLDLLVYRVDSLMQAVRVALAQPSHDAKRLTRLLIDKIETIDPGFGIEVMELVAVLTQPLPYRQRGTLEEAPPADVAALIDTLANRIGAERLYRATPIESELPERSVGTVAPLAPPCGATWAAAWPRPTRLVSPPEPIETLALLPDHPPAQFTWRGQRRRVIRSDGPERIYGEWHRRDAELAEVRDYFMVEDEAGQRFWVFRAGDGQDPGTGSQAWYLHGLFA